MMPELPEVESAVRRLRAATIGKHVGRLSLLHPALRRRITPSALRSLRGARIDRVERRGKHQLIVLDDGRVLHAHFRMTGDWDVGRIDDDLPRFARASLELDDGSRVVLEDPRMLSTLDLHPRGAKLNLGLGPEPSDPALTESVLFETLAKRRGPIKPVLLDQRVIAGLGNIYAAESLWHAKISPLRRASSLDRGEVRALLVAVRRVIARATGARYTDSSVSRLAVYGREGKPCRRCGTAIERIAQAGRSTYYCPNCQSGDEKKARVVKSRVSRGPR